MDAPERIWAFPKADWFNAGASTHRIKVAGAKDVEYVRADALAARDAEIERLRARIAEMEALLTRSYEIKGDLERCVAEKDEALAHFYSGDGLDEAALLIQSILHPLKAQHDPDHAVQVGIRMLIDRVRARKALEG